MSAVPQVGYYIAGVKKKSNRDCGWRRYKAAVLSAFFPARAGNSRKDPSQDAHIARLKACASEELPERGHYVGHVRVIKEPDVAKRLLQVVEESFEVRRPG